jgi:hypothetical protein
MTILIVTFRNFANAPKTNGMRNIVITITIIILRHQNCPPTRYCMNCHLLSLYSRLVIFFRNYLTSNMGCKQLLSPPLFATIRLQGSVND